MKKQTSLLIGTGLFLAAVCFLCYAGKHPEAAFPWNNHITFLGYGMYAWLLFKFLLDIPFFRPRRTSPPKKNVWRALTFFAMAIVFFLMEFTMESADIYTVLRGFIVLGGIDTGLESLSDHAM